MRHTARNWPNSTAVLLFATSLLAVAPFGVALSATTANADPPGNNGTVKIQEVLADDTPDDGIPDNDPHVGCTFTVEWYGFDEGADIISQVTFTMQDPTADVGLSVAGDTSVFVGADPQSGAGNDDGFDGKEVYVLSFDGLPHPEQGYHVKIEVNTPGSQGNDAKFKVYWVDGCRTTTTPVTPTTPTTPVTPLTPTTPVTPLTPTTSATTQTVPTTSAATVTASQPTPSTEVLGEQASQDDTKGKDQPAQEAETPEVEVLGEQAAVPTQVAAGLSGDMSQASSSSSSLWLAGMTGLLAAAIALGLLSSRRLRGRD